MVPCPSGRVRSFRVHQLFRNHPSSRFVEVERCRHGRQFPIPSQGPGSSLGTFTLKIATARGSPIQKSRCGQRSTESFKSNPHQASTLDR